MTSERPMLATALGLEPHPEGGWFRETWRPDQTFSPDGYSGPRTAASLIYFLLAPGEESRWHVVRSDEVWLWHRGGTLTLRLGGSGDQPDPTPEELTLGPDIETGARPQIVVPAGTWQSARPDAREPVLVSCAVSPGFDFDDFRLL